MGVEAARIPALAVMAAEDPTAGSNPVLLDVAAAERLYEDAM